MMLSSVAYNNIIMGRFMSMLAHPLSVSMMKQAASATVPMAQAQSRFKRHNEEFQKKMSNPEVLSKIPCDLLQELEKESSVLKFMDKTYRLYTNPHGPKTSNITSNELTSSNSICVLEKVPHIGEHDMQFIDQVILGLHA